MIAGHWLPAKDGDSRAFALYSRHYTYLPYADGRRQRHGYRNKYHIVGPGEKMVLLTVWCDALFVWRKFIDKSGQIGVNCAVFRNESKLLSSELILEAEQLAWRRWPGERLYTYVSEKHTKGRRSKHHLAGHCFRVAGWRECGRTKTRKLLILEKLPP